MFGGKPGPLRLMGLFVLGLVLLTYPLPGANRPAVDAAIPNPLQSSLAAMTSCLHI